MTRHLLLATCLLLGVAYSCNGQLDAFTEVESGATGGSGRGGAAGGGLGGTGTGGLGGSSNPFGGEGGEEDIRDMLLIDDFEDGDQLALISDAEWRVSNNASGVQNLAVELPAIGRSGSRFSLHTSGVDFEISGAGLVLDIAGSASSYDASNYAALTFWARAEPGSNPEALLSFLVGSRNFAVPVRFDTVWARHTIPFAAAIPVEDPGATLDPSALAAIQFTTPVDVSFDFWLDDLAFVR